MDTQSISVCIFVLLGCMLVICSHLCFLLEDSEASVYGNLDIEELLNFSVTLCLFVLCCFFFFFFLLLPPHYLLLANFHRFEMWNIMVFMPLTVKNKLKKKSPAFHMFLDLCSASIHISLSFLNFLVCKQTCFLPIMYVLYFKYSILKIWTSGFYVMALVLCFIFGSKSI